MRALHTILGAGSFSLLLLTPLAEAQAPAQTAAPTEAAANCKIWVGRAEVFEEFLKSAEIVRMEEIPVGVTKPVRAYLTPGGLAESMAFKQIPPGRYRGFWESYKAEIAAYELDKVLGMNMIPPTVEKRIKGNLGAAVMWVSPIKSFKELGGPPTAPAAQMDSWNRQVVRAKMFDNLICNKDPNEGNWLLDPSWNLVLIDHTRSFTTTKDLVFPITRIDREFWEKMKSLDEATLTKALSNWLDKGAIRAILERRDKMAAEIEKAIGTKGEAQVFLP